MMFFKAGQWKSWIARSRILFPMSVAQCFVFVTIMAAGESTLIAQNFSDPSLQPNAATTPTDQFNNQRPVHMFRDYAGQVYGRFIEYETVPVAKYQNRQVTQRVWQPRWVTETRTTTQTQYVPTYTYQTQLRNVSGWNPFAPPRQVMETVPVPYYQANHVQVSGPVTFLKYEEQEVTVNVPDLVSTSEQRAKYVDRPLTPNQVAMYSNGNPIQPNLVASANINTPRYPLLPIDNTPRYYANNGYNRYGYGYPSYAPVLTPPQPAYVSPQPYSPQPPLSNYAAYQATGLPSAYANNPRPLPMVSLQNGGNGTPPTNAYANATLPYPQPYYASPYGGYATNPYAPPSVQTASYTPNQAWSQLLTGTGTLFRGGLLRNNRNYSTVAYNTPPSQPYLFSPNTSNNGSNAIFRPSTSPFTNPGEIGQAPMLNNQPASMYRDPSQAGTPTTVLR